MNAAMPQMPPLNSGAPVRKRGQVKFFDSKKGFGFIKCDDGTRDVFLSINNLPKGAVNPIPDQRCSFVVAEGKKGPYALEFMTL